MLKFLFSICIFLAVNIKAQQFLKGNLVNEDQQQMYGVEVLNMRTKIRVFSDSKGDFSIKAQPGDLIIFLRRGYERLEITLKESHLQEFLKVKLTAVYHEISEVTINSSSQKENLSDKLGIPKPIGKMREKAPEVKADLLQPLLRGMLNVDALYKIVSGKATRMKREYRYYDLQVEIKDAIILLQDEFFEQNNIPKEKQSELILFVMGKVDISHFIKTRNNNGLGFIISKYIAEFKNRLNNQK